MTTTKFNFVYAAGDDTRADPIRHRRSRLVERLQVQAKLAIPDGHPPNPYSE